MKHIYMVLNWAFGVLFLLSGLASLFESPLAGLALFSIAALLLPPVRNWVYSKTGKELTTKARAASIFVLFIVFGISVGESTTQNAELETAQADIQRAQLEATEKQKTIEYFHANSQQILADTKTALDAGEYQKSIALSSKYLAANNEALSQLNAIAKTKLAEKRSADHLIEAKKALDEWKPNKDPMKTTWGRVTDAEKHIEAIKPESKEYSEAQALKKEVDRRKAEIERLAGIMTREFMAKQLEQNYLQKGLDVYVSLHDKNKSTMKLRFVLFSRPLVHNLSNDPEFIGALRKSGFKKIIFTDGYDSSWTMSL